MTVTHQLTVPFHSAEETYLDGPACAQMVLESVGATGLLQDTLYTEITAANAEPASWYTDPQGLSDTMNSNRPAGFNGVFVIKEHPDFDAGSRQLVYTSHKYNVAPIALTLWGGHWMVVKGAETTSDPLVDPYDILNFWVHNPWGSAGATGEDELITYTDWANWYHGVSLPGSAWDGKWVAICDPPPAQLGPITRLSPERLFPGNRVVEPGRIIEALTIHLEQRGLLRHDRLARFLERTEKGQPMLVQRGRRFEYLVPMLRNRNASALIRLDAMTGELLHVIPFREPQPFPRLGLPGVRKLLDSGRLDLRCLCISEFGAGEALIRKLRVERGTWCINPTLFWTPCWESRHPAYPFWQVSIGGESFYIAAWSGAVYPKLHRFGPGVQVRVGV